MSLINAYFFAQLMIGLYYSDLQKDEKVEFLGGMNESEYLMSTFLLNLGFIAKSGKKQKEYRIKFMDLRQFVEHISSK